MAKFNVVQKRRRAAVANRKRLVHGDPFSGKLHQKPQPLSVSGKRKRKLEKKLRRDQKEAVAKGLITMQDMEMAVADWNSESSKAVNRTPVNFPMKKSSKFKVKQFMKKGKNQKTSQKPARAGEPSADSMVE